MEYCIRMKIARQQKGDSQAKIAELLETTQQHYSAYEKGTHELPIRHLITLCKYYNVSADWLLGLKESR